MENKQTLEEVAKKEAQSKYGLTIYEIEQVDAFIDGAKWQADRMYSEEDVENILIEYVKTNPTKPYRVISWFSQFKKTNNGK